MSSLLTAFSSMPGFMQLAPSLQRELVEKSRLERLPREKWLFGEGEVPDHPALIISGTAGVHRSVASRTVLVGIVGAGTIVGQIPTSHGALPYTVIARTNMLVAHFPRLDGSSSNPLAGELAHFLLGRQARQVGTMLQRTTDRANLPPLARVAAELAYLAEQAPTCPIEVSQQELGEMVGLSRKTVNRCLGELSRRAAISNRYAAISVVDPHALKAMASGEGRMI